MQNMEVDVGTETNTNTEVAMEPLTEREIAIAAGDEPGDAVVPAKVGDVKDDEADANVTSKDGTDADPNNADPVAETDGEGESPADAGGTESTYGDWFGEDEARTAVSVGLTEDDMKGITSPEHFKSVVTVLDRYKAAKNPTGVASKDKPGVGGPTGGVPTGDSQSDSSGAADPKEPTKLNLQEYIDEGYDEKTLDMVRVAIAAQDEVQQLRQLAEQTQGSIASMLQDQELNSFNDVVDGMRDELFGETIDTDGKVVEIAGDPAANRNKLLATTRRLQDLMKQEGSAPPSYAAIVHRARDIEFSTEMMERKSKELHRSLTAQSNKKRRVGSTKRAPQAPPTDSDDDIVNHPALVALFDKFTDENGQ